MTFVIKASTYFAQQVKKLDNSTKQQIKEKIELIKQNPFRYKKIRSQHFSKVFRVRLNINGKEARLVYLIVEPNIILACLLDRKNKDLEEFLKKIKN